MLDSFERERLILLILFLAWSSSSLNSSLVQPKGPKPLEAKYSLVKWLQHLRRLHHHLGFQREGVFRQLLSWKMYRPISLNLVLMSTLPSPSYKKGPSFRPSSLSLYAYPLLYISWQEYACICVWSKVIVLTTIYIVCWETRSASTWVLLDVSVDRRCIYICSLCYFRLIPFKTPDLTANSVWTRTSRWAGLDFEV